jgi:prepilin-type N-terminal cleavage/methylation domain-containing protein
MSNRGFTLIELSMVFLVIGLIVGGGVIAIGPTLDKTRRNVTVNTLDQVESSLVLFAIRSNRLPCPADGSLPPNDSNYGVEQPSGGGTCSVAISNSVIPWITLGLDEGYSLDGWGNRLSYVPSGAQVASWPLVTGGTPGTLGSNIYRSGTTYPTGPFITVTDVLSSNAITNATGNDQAAYVLISHGKSGWYGWPKASGSTPVSQFAPTVAEAGKACNNDPVDCAIGTAPTFVSGSQVGKYPPAGNAAYFDDIVRWRSPAFIIQLCGSGACGNP